MAKAKRSGVGRGKGTGKGIGHGGLQTGPQNGTGPGSKNGKCIKKSKLNAVRSNRYGVRKERVEELSSLWT